MLAINAVPPSEYLVADKGYDSNALRSCLIERGTTPVIPSKCNRKVQIEHDRQIYRQRNVVERMFCRFKDWRRVATRFDRNIKIWTPRRTGCFRPDGGAKGLIAVLGA